jgi:hypothetical protein
MRDMNKYENLTFEEATRIIYWNFSNDLKVFKSTMEDLMDGEQQPYKCVAPKWYDCYRDMVAENKNAK